MENRKCLTKQEIDNQCHKILLVKPSRTDEAYYTFSTCERVKNCNPSNI